MARWLPEAGRALWVAATLWCARPGNAVAAPDRSSEAILFLRHYALSACLAQAFPAIRDEALAAQGAYLEFGSHSPETYQAVQDMAHRWLQKDYPSFRNANLDVMKCIDLSESAELGTLARRTLPKHP